MEKKYKPISEMDRGERWKAFELEVLFGIIIDSKIEEDEKILMNCIAPLYLGIDHVPIIHTEHWRKVKANLDRALKNKTTKQLLKFMVERITRRLIEPNHIKLPKKNYHWFCDWLFKQHNDTEDYWDFPETKRKDDFAEKEAGDRFEIEIPNEKKVGYPSEIISSSYNQWKGQPVPPKEENIIPSETGLAESLSQTLDMSNTGRLLGELETLLENSTELMAKMAFAQDTSNPVWFVDEVDPEQEIWFAGDVHGDLLAFEAVCQCFEKHQNKNAKLIFLGDLVDRGAHHLEVIYSLLSKINDTPNTYGWIAGNHDLGLQFSTEKNCFSSKTSPAEFPDLLNKYPENNVLISIGKSFIKIANKLPQAIFFPGLLAAHGGFPHSDLWDCIKQPSDFFTKQCLTDFTHNRIHHSKKKFPNRKRSGSQFGSEDFSNFLNLCHDLNIPINSMVRGHDHISDQTARWDRPTQVRKGDYEARVLTINSLSYTQTGEMSPYAPDNPRQPVIARWQEGDILPTPYVINLSSDIVENYIKPCSVCNKPTIEQTCTCEMVDHRKKNEQEKKAEINNPTRWKKFVPWLN